MNIIRAHSEKDFRLVADLLTESERERDSLSNFADFQREVKYLPGRYASGEGGILLLAQDDGEAAGVAAVRRTDGPVCELKRFFVRLKFRGAGIERRLAMAAINEARSEGYKRMTVTVLPSMAEELNLYYSLGFLSQPPCEAEQSPRRILLELDLNS